MPGSQHLSLCNCWLHSAVAGCRTFKNDGEYERVTRRTERLDEVVTEDALILKARVHYSGQRAAAAAAAGCRALPSRQRCRWRRLLFGWRSPAHDGMPSPWLPLVPLQADVEGFEPSVLRGAKGLLAAKKVAHLFMEYSPGVAGERRQGQCSLWGWRDTWRTA